MTGSNPELSKDAQALSKGMEPASNHQAEVVVWALG